MARLCCSRQRCSGGHVPAEGSGCDLGGLPMGKALVSRHGLAACLTDCMLHIKPSSREPKLPVICALA